jgi:hypothetical protein
MPHKIQVILAKEYLIDQLCENWVHAQKLNLPQGFALLPLQVNLNEDIEELINNENPDPYEEFEYLSASLNELLTKESAFGEIAFLETDYTGGNGRQSAILYVNKQGTGPFSTITEWNDDTLEMKDKPEGERAINKILFKMGVSSNYRDAFNALKLDHLTNNSKIIAKIRETQKKEKQE